MGSDQPDLLKTEKQPSATTPCGHPALRSHIHEEIAVKTEARRVLDLFWRPKGRAWAAGSAVHAAVSEG